MTATPPPPFRISLSQTPKTVRFKKAPATSRVIHWENPEGMVWRAVDCDGRDCLRCLGGARVQQRFSAVVVHEGEEKWLEIPMPGWLVLLRRMRIMGEKFYDTDFVVSRKRTSMATADFFFDPAPAAEVAHGQ